MKIKITTGTTVEVQQWVTGSTIFNTDDYTELKGKTVDEIKQMDVTTLLKLKTNKGECLVETLDYEYECDDYMTLDVDYEKGEKTIVTDIDMDGWDTEIWKYPDF